MYYSISDSTWMFILEAVFTLREEGDWYPEDLFPDQASIYAFTLRRIEARYKGRTWTLP